MPRRGGARVQLNPTKKMKSEEAHKGLNRAFKEFYTSIFDKVCQHNFKQPRHKLKSHQTLHVVELISRGIKKTFGLSDTELPDLKYAIEILAHRKRGEENMSHLSEEKKQFLKDNFNEVICTKNKKETMQAHYDIPEAKYLWKFFFEFPEAIQQTIYTKFKKPSEKDLIYNNICEHLEPEFLPKKENFFGTPLAKKELDKDNRRKAGKKSLFIQMNLTSWLNKDLWQPQELVYPDTALSEDSNSVTITEAEPLE